MLKPKQLACERPPLRHTAVSNITHSAIADQDSSPSAACPACMLHTLCWAASHTQYTSVPSCAVGLHAPCIGIIDTERCQNVCVSALLRFRSLHMNCGVNGSVCSADCMLSCTVGMRCVCACPVVLYMYVYVIWHRS